MRGRPKTRGTIKEIRPQGASVKLDDGRDGLVSRTDCFWNEWVGKRALAAGDSVVFEVLGVLPDGSLSLGFQSIGERTSHLLGSDGHRGPGDPKYWLSPDVCLGVLRRAEQAGKKLPEALVRALRAESQRQSPSDKGAEPPKS